MKVQRLLQCLTSHRQGHLAGLVAFSTGLCVTSILRKHGTGSAAAQDAFEQLLFFKFTYYKCISLDPTNNFIIADLRDIDLNN